MIDLLGISRDRIEHIYKNDFLNVHQLFLKQTVAKLGRTHAFITWQISASIFAGIITKHAQLV